MREEVITSIFSTLCLGKVYKVSSAYGALCAPSPPPVFNVRLAPHQWLMNYMDYWYKLTVVVRARLKGVSACGLRNPIRPFSTALVRAHLTNTSDANKATELRCSPFDAYLDAFSGALIRSYARFAFPLMGKQLKIATPFRGCLNTKLPENVFMA